MGMSLHIHFNDNEEAKLAEIIKKAGFNPGNNEIFHAFISYKLGILEKWPVYLRSTSSNHTSNEY